MMGIDIREDMMVHALSAGHMNGVIGEHIGTVDAVEGERIKLTKNDSPDGLQHYIPLAWVKSVEGNTIHLSKDSSAVIGEWQDA